MTSIPYLHACRLSFRKFQPSAARPERLKAYLVMIGLRALREGDVARVDLITHLIRAGGLSHE